MLSDVKLLLGIEDTSRDSLLELLISTAKARLKTLLGGVEPPDSLSYIVRDVAIIRFNKIGSEGVDSHTVEGESMTFTEDDFSQFKDEIQAFLDTQKESARGKVRFL
jgi:hypothetical protein